MKSEDHTRLISSAAMSRRGLAKVSKEIVRGVYGCTLLSLVNSSRLTCCSHFKIFCGYLSYWCKKRCAAGQPLIPRLQIEMEEIKHSSVYVNSF